LDVTRSDKREKFNQRKKQLPGLSKQALKSVTAKNHVARLQGGSKRALHRDESIKARVVAKSREKKFDKLEQKAMWKSATKVVVSSCVLDCGLIADL
jgi:hypothetical protein